MTAEKSGFGTPDIKVRLEMLFVVLVALVYCSICGAFTHSMFNRIAPLMRIHATRLVPMASKNELQVQLENEFVELTDAIDLNQELEDDADDEDFVAYLQDEFNSLSTNGK